ncbi:LuxR family transcriptional regulator [Mycobacterium basiliense]
MEAREAYERRDWVAAYERLSDLDTAAQHGADFACLATAAYLTGRNNDCVQALQRAYHSHLDRADVMGALRCAFWLARTLHDMGETAIASGWQARMQRLLEDAAGDVAERGYLQILRMFRHLSAAEFQDAAECAASITDYGRRFHDADLTAVGLSSQGRLLIYAGQVRHGFELLDESMVDVAAGAVSTIFAGQVYCSMIEACQETSDFDRAAQWTTALTRWCADQRGLIAFTGQCAVHRGQIMRVLGCYREALQEFSLAVERYRVMEAVAPTGLAFAERGDVLRILGEFDAAEEAYQAARQYGHDPQPGLVLLWLAQGRTASAVHAMRRLLAESRHAIGRSQLLPAAVQILVSAGELDQAERLSGELTQIAAEFGSTGIRAMAAYATGAVANARGDHGRAIAQLRAAADGWANLNAPCELARCSTLIGRSLRALGDEDSAVVEFQSAQRVFAELRLANAARDVARLLRPSTPGGLTAREVEVLRLVAAGKTNSEIAQSLVLSEKTVARHLSNIFAKLDVKSRTAAAAYAFNQHLV